MQPIANNNEADNPHYCQCDVCKKARCGQEVRWTYTINLLGVLAAWLAFVFALAYFMPIWQSQQAQAATEALFKSANMDSAGRRCGDPGFTGQCTPAEIAEWVNQQKAIRGIK